jgi:hypothetical protein
MRYRLNYLKAVLAPAETRCCRCRPSSMPTLDGKPVVLAMQDGRFESGTYHQACIDCSQGRTRRQAWFNQRELDRAKVLVS